MSYQGMTTTTALPMPARSICTVSVYASFDISTGVEGIGRQPHGKWYCTCTRALHANYDDNGVHRTHMKHFVARRSADGASSTDSIPFICIVHLDLPVAMDIVFQQVAQFGAPFMHSFSS